MMATKKQWRLLFDSFVFIAVMMMELAHGFVLRSRCCPTLSRPFWPSSRLAAEPHDNESATTPDSANSSMGKTIVVVGGGWAGFSAADALCQAGASRVHLLDASPRGPGGLARAWRTPKLQRPVEAGIHGFWRDYSNTFDTIQNCMGIDDIDSVLTTFLPSTLVSSSGRVATAPVLGQDDNPPPVPAPFRNLPLLPELVANLPPPLDVALLTEFKDPSTLSVTDRLSGLGLLGAWADFGQQDRDSWLRYDNISADNLFRNQAAFSPRLYRELVAPLLHVLPMTTGYDCSAAAALSCFHVFALASRGAFDVRWCRGSIGEVLFDPWTKKLKTDYPSVINIQGGSKVTSVVCSDSTKPKFTVTVQKNGNEQGETLECDAVVMAVGAVSAGRLAATCPAFNPFAKEWKAWRGVTCVAVRLFLDPKAWINTPLQDSMADSPVVVCGPDLLLRQKSAPSKYSSLLVETGFCLYDLARLQDEFSASASEMVVLEVDFFRANALADCDDDTIVSLTLHAICAALEVDDSMNKLSKYILDQSIVRSRQAVSHFFPGSAAISPPTKLSAGLYMCGDWIDRTGHASWSTEKAVVTGRQAAAACAQDLGLNVKAVPPVLPAPPDTPALQSLRQFARLWRIVNPLAKYPRAPWAP